MACQEFQCQILDYLENQLPSTQRRAVAAHLVCCADCAVWARELSRLDAALTEAVPRPTLGSDFCTRLRKRIRTEDLLLPESERAERKRRLQAEYETRLIDLRRAFFRSVSFMESVGWVVLAVWGGWLLSTLGLSLIKSIAEQGPGSFRETQLLLLTASAVFVSVGLSAAFPRKFAHLVRKLTPQC